MHATTQALRNWAAHTARQLTERAERLFDRVDREYRERGDYRFLLAREAMTAKCMSVRFEHAVRAADVNGDAAELHALWSDYVRRGYQPLGAGCGIRDRAQAPVAA